MSSFNFAKKLLPAKKACNSFKFKFQSKLHKLRTTTTKAIKATKNYYIKTLHKIRLFIPRSPRSRRHFHYYRHRQEYMRKNSSSSAILYVDEIFPGHACRMQNHPAKKWSSSSSTSVVDEARDEKSWTNNQERTQILNFREVELQWHEGKHGSEIDQNKSTKKNSDCFAGVRPFSPCYTSTYANNLEIQPHKIYAPGVKILEKKGCETSSTTTPADGRKIPSLLQFPCHVDERAEEFISKFRLKMKLEREQSIIDYQEMLARSV